MRAKHSRPALAGLVGLIFLAHCEPADEGPPVASPLPAQPEPVAAPEPPTDTAGDETAYASDEYVVGEDSERYDDRDPSALTDFRRTLDPYGAWKDDPTYGTVWTPSPAAVGPEFQPYVTAGHWAYDDDWVWESDYPWGWAPFHYGRWVLIEGSGWGWIPGRAYAGAWVMWSVDDGFGYVGWAPAPPLFVWFGGVPVGWGLYLRPHWAYCRHDEVFAPGVSRHVLVGPAAGPIAGRMRVYVPATPGVGGGPPPQRLGYAPGQIPSAAPAAAPGLARAQQFARPSTAQPLGARPPTRIEIAPRGVAASVSPATPRVPYGGARSPVLSVPRQGGFVPPRPSAPPVFRPPTVAPRAPVFRPPTVAPQAPGYRPVTPAQAPAVHPAVPRASGARPR